LHLAERLKITSRSEKSKSTHLLIEGKKPIIFKKPKSKMPNLWWESQVVYTQLRQSQSQQITQIKFILTNVISQVIHSFQALISPTILTSLLIDKNPAIGRVIYQSGV